MNARTPFVVPANRCNRFLSLVHAKSRIRHSLVIKLRRISAIRFILLDVTKNTVLRRDLLFKRERKLPLLNIIVWPLAGIGTVKRVEIVIKISERAELRAGFRPCAAAQILRVRGHSKSVALKKFRVFL